MLLKLRLYLQTFWRVYVLILTPILLMPIILHGMSDVSTSNEANEGISNVDNSSATFDENIAPVKSDYEAMVCAYVLLLMAIYWMTEVLPLPITALIPIVAFPFFGVLSTSEVAMNYMRATNFMMLGGLMLGVCVEHSGLHKRIALRIILFLGTSPNMILFGFMVTTAFVSMWISNGATAAMMVPIIDAFVAVLHNSEEEVTDIELGHPHSHKPTRTRTKEEESLRNLLLLSVAYSACIGGTGVITGNPSNLVILEVLPAVAGINFATWMSFTVPLMVVNLFFAWVWLAKMYSWQRMKFEKPLTTVDTIVDAKLNVTYQTTAANETNNDVNVTLNPNVEVVIPQSPVLNKKRHQNEVQERVTKVMTSHYNALGHMTLHEWSVVVCFSALIMLWFFRD